MMSDTNPTTLSRRVGLTLWFGYSIRLPDTDVIQRFTSRYGYPPKEVLRGPAIVLAGPIIQNDAQDVPEGLEMPV